jgi:hypothetical protein
MSDGEVKIICLVDAIHLSDLGLRIARGASVSVSMSAAMKSRDLSKAKMDGTVSTQTLRSSVIRSPDHVSFEATPAPIAIPPSPRSSPPELAPELAPVLAALQRLTDEVRGLRADLASRPVAPSPVSDPSVRRTGTPVGTERPGSSVGDEFSSPETVFIPSNLTGGNLPTNFNVSSESTEDPGLADTMAALKAARNRR